MNTLIDECWIQAEGTYLNSGQLNSVQNYIESLPQRILIYQELQAQEDALLDRIMEKFKPTLPNLTRQHGHLAWDRCRRDLSMVWRYCCMAYLLNDESYLQDKLLYWMETILKSFKIRDKCQLAYKLMLDSLQYVFSDQTQGSIRPYVQLAKSMLVN